MSRSIKIHGSLFRGWRHFYAPLLAGVILPAILLSNEIVDDRYDNAPRLDDKGASLRALVRGEVDADGADETVLLRFVEGLDPGPRPMTTIEMSAQIHDPFGLRLEEVVDHLPANVNEVLGLLGPPNSPASALPDQTVYIVHDAGQIPVEAAPNLLRRPRAVILRRDELAREAVFIAPSMRETGTLEVMGWDQTKGVFNFYERTLTAEDTPVWVWKGDSSHAWDVQTRPHACFRCHRNGEPNMKELRVPWQNWHSQSANIKPESIPLDSPLRSDPLFSIEPPGPFLRGGEELERIINQWLPRTGATKIARFRSGELSAEVLLEPFFRTTTLTLKTSSEQSESVGTGPIDLPVSFFIDQRGLADVGGLMCARMLTFPSDISVPRPEYRSLLQRLGFRMEQPGTYELNPGDTHFAFAASEVPRVDFEMINQLVDAGIVSRRTAANLLLLDFPNPVYSPIRQALYSALEARPLAVDPGEPFDNALHAFVADVAADPTVPAEVRAEADDFLVRATIPESDFKRQACDRIEPYLDAVAARFASGEAEDYFKLLAARYEALMNSDHNALIESHLLIPKTDPFPGLVMRASGAVELSTLNRN